MKKYIIIFFLGAIPGFIFAQGKLSGDIQLNTNLYDQDSVIGANTTQYLHEMSSSESWLRINYIIEGFTITGRFDLYNNSPLLDPQEAYTNSGLGFYSINKKIDNLDITAGYFYDQIGTGIIFRAYEDRTLGIDYAINGVKLKYDFNKTFRIKGFTGRQKHRFDFYPQVIKGLELQKDLKITENLQMNSGLGFMNRTLDQRTMESIVNEINSYNLIDRFVPKYNLYAVTGYTNLVYKNLTGYFEYAYKNAEAIKNKTGEKLISSDGNVIFTSLNYSKKRLGISLQYKKTDHFPMRTSPFAMLLEGQLNYMPPMSKQHSKVLAARYMISAKDFGEQAFMADLTYSPGKHSTFTGSFSYVLDDEQELVFREIYGEFYHKFSKVFKTTVALQSVFYNKLVYQNHLETRLDGNVEPEIVQTITPLVEASYKFSSKKAIRCEAQYLMTKEDHGDFFFGLLEYSVAPHWSFSFSDMVNTKPQKLPEVEHYYNASVYYSINKSRFSLGYMKQVEGVVCTGGVCRLEPAFSGMKFSMTSTF